MFILSNRAFALVVLFFLPFFATPVDAQEAPAESVSPVVGEAKDVPATPDLSVALSLQSAFAKVAEQVFPSVVTVTAFRRQDAPADEPSSGSTAAWVASATERDYPGFELTGSGTGVVFGEEGYIVSCRHFLVDANGELPEFVEVETQDRVRCLGRVVSAEPTLDLAVIQVQVVPSDDAFVRPRFGDSDAVEVGHWAIAVGDPFGPERVLSPGVFTAKPSRDCYQEQLSATFLQTSMPVDADAFGGPLVNIHGEVVGIVMPVNPTTDEEMSNDTTSKTRQYALPIKIVENLYTVIRKKKTVVSPWIGFAVMSVAELRKEFGVEKYRALSRPRTGIYIENVFDPSPAMTVGLKRGDFLVRFAGVPIRTPIEFQKQLYLADIGQTVELEMFRDGELFTVEVEIEPRPANATTR